MEIKEIKDTGRMIEIAKMGEVYRLRSCVDASILVDGTPYSFLPTMVKGILSWVDYDLIRETSSCFAIDVKENEVHFTKDGSKIVYDEFTCKNLVKRAKEIEKYVINLKYKELHGNILRDEIWDDIVELETLTSDAYVSIPYSFPVVVEDEVYNSSKVLSILEKWEETVVNHNKIFNVENGIKNHSIRMLEIRCAVKRGSVFKRTENVDVSKAKELSLYVDSVVELRNWLLEKVGNCPVKRLLINGMCNSIKLK